MDNINILVVDDDDSLRFMVSALLRKHHYDVTEVPSAKEALSQFHKNPPDLILSDVDMPEMNGFQLLSYVKANNSSMVPVILMSGTFTDIKSLKYGLKNGADDYLIKPIKEEELLYSVKSRINYKRSIQAKLDGEVDKWKNSIAMMLPHELNTPLAGIIGCAECVLDTATDSGMEEMAWFAKSIIKNGNRLERLVKNFLLYLQLKVLNNKNIDTSLTDDFYVPKLHNIREEALEIASLYSRESDLTVEIQHPFAPINLEIFNRIFSEILDNAFKFSMPGSPVSVRFRQKDDQLVLDVFDSGIGFDTENIRVEAFVQFNRKEMEQQGLGLGLFIAKMLTEMNEGIFNVRSEPRKSTHLELIWKG